MENKYLILDSREKPVAHGYSQSRLEDPIFQVKVDENIEELLDHEYIKLINMSQNSATIE